MEQLKSVRQNLGITQEAFAEMLGISRSALNMAEQGKRGLPEIALLKMGQLTVAGEQVRIESPASEFDAKKCLKEILQNRILKYEAQLHELQSKKEKYQMLNKTAPIAIELIRQELKFFGDLDAYAEKLRTYESYALAESEKSQPEAIAELDWRIREINALIELATNELARL